MLIVVYALLCKTVDFLPYELFLFVMLMMMVFSAYVVSLGLQSGVFIVSSRWQNSQMSW